MKRRWITGTTCVAMVVAGLALPSPVAAVGPTFVVNSTVDADDAVIDGVCQTITAGQCTLRAALTEASAHTSDHVTVSFNIPGSGVRTIRPQTRLPLIDNGAAGITIDGFTQPGASQNTDPLVDNGTRLIEIVGTGPTGIDGLVVLGSNNVIRGLSIHGFKRAVRFTGRAAQYNEAVGNILGLAPNGDLDPTYANVVGAPCVDINQGASRNLIGKPGNENRNIISGCYEKGVTMYNEFTFRNLVQNNIIGLDPTGSQRRASYSIGIDVNWSANGNIIGGIAAQERNVISGNQLSGIEISHGTGTVNNKVIGNYIGTDPTGMTAPPYASNTHAGVRLEGTPDCGTRACPEDAGKNTVTDNVIVNSTWGGVLVDKGVHDSTIANNLIGQTLNGTVVGNGTFAVRLSSGAVRNTIGPGNVIVGNHAGVQLDPRSVDPAGDTPTMTQNNLITNNTISVTSGLAIDFLPYGSINTAGNGSPYVNQRIDAPVLSNVGDAVRVSTCATCAVELYESSVTTLGAPGSGIRLLGSGTADAAGTITFAAPANGWPGRVAATSTTPQLSTSEFSLVIRPGAATAPAAPTIGVATAEPGQARVSFTPGDDHGSPVSRFDVTATDLTDQSAPQRFGTGSGSPVLVTGLTNFHDYRFTVTATNAVGTSPPSAPSNVVQPAPNITAHITSFSPQKVGQNASFRTIKVNGDGFVAGSTLVISGAGVTVKSLSTSSSTLMVATISVSGDAAPGPRSAVVTKPDGGIGRCTDCFVVTPAPVITAMSTTTFYRAQPTTELRITGTNLNAGLSVTVTGTGITIGQLGRIDASTITVPVTVDAAAALGARTLKVVNSDAGYVATTITVADATVPSAPGVPTATASSGAATVSFAPATSPGSPITSYTVTAADATNPARGGQTVSGTTSPLTIVGLTAGDTYSFTVRATNAAGTGPASAPSNSVVPTASAPVAVTSLSPSALGQGAASRQVRVIGSGFAPGAVVTVSGTGVSVRSTTVTSTTEIMLKVTVDPGASLGARDVRVTNVDGGTALCVGCFTVRAAPTVTSIAPNAVARGTTTTITISGTDFNSGVAVLVSGSGLTLGTVTRTGTTSLQVSVTAAANAATGARDVTVRNSDSSGVVVVGGLAVT